MPLLINLTLSHRNCQGCSWERAMDSFLSVLERWNGFIPPPLLSQFNTCLGCWISYSSVFGISYSFSIWIPPLLLSLSWLSQMPYF